MKWDTVTVKNKKLSKTPIRRALMEELEPRLLFSADLPGVLAQSGLLGSDTQSIPPAIIALVDTPALGVAIGHQEQTPTEAGFSLNQPRAGATPQKELVFVDAGAPNYQQLINDLMKAQAGGRHIEVVVLESGRDGVEQITEAMAERRDVGAVHIVSHGSDGSLRLGNVELSAYNLERYGDAIASWEDSLTEGADLLIYGCDFAGSAQGREMVETLSALTGADVAASTDKTGNVNLGGDWELEFNSGEIETSLAFSLDVQQNWGHTLAIAADGSASTNQGTSTSTISVAHTVSAGSDRLLLVGISMVDQGGAPGVSTGTPPTWGATPLTRVGWLDSTAAGDDFTRTEIWSFINPAAGPDNVSVTLNAASDGVVVGVMSFTGVDQSTPIGDQAFDTDDSSGGSVNLTSAADELVFSIITAESSGDENFSPGTATEEWDLFPGGATNSGGSTEVGTASHTVSWSGFSDKWVIGAVSIKPSSNLVVDTDLDILDGDTSSIANLLGNKGADGFVSLREAIQAANNTPGLDDISFGIAGAGLHTITLDSALDPITEAVNLDATTQPGFGSDPIIEITASGLFLAGDGFFLDSGSDGSTIRGFIINGIPDDGIQIDSGGNTIAGNWIGLDNTGMLDPAPGNADDGIDIAGGAGGNIIGGLTAADRNVIAGNADDGIKISNSDNNVIQGNYIGTSKDGLLGRGNAGAGIKIRTTSTGNVIGGTTAAARNIIADNIQGIYLADPATGTIIQGNYIGLDVTGDGLLGNSQEGIRSENSDGNTIGGIVPGAGNVISGNGAFGINIHDADGNTIQGNFIGTDATGMFARANAGGILLEEGAQNNIIGGTAAAARNVISGNAGIGIQTLNTLTQFNVIQGNFIGLGSDGDKALGNTGDGIQINTSNNIIGGSVTGAGNVISDSGDDGISIQGGASGTVIQGNRIGTDASGLLDRGNSKAGIHISGPTSNNIVGGRAYGEGNIIAFNGSDGIIGASGTGNLFVGNAIHSNSALGIDLDNDDVVNVNDNLDPDSGANDIQNSPTLIGILTDGNVTRINGSINSTANTELVIDVYANLAGEDQGRQYLGSHTVVTDAAGDASFMFTLPVGVLAGQELTATATDPNGSTSEFGVALTVGAGAGNGLPTLNDDNYTVAQDTTLDIDWWDTGWSSRRLLTFDNLNQAEDLTNFPVLVKLDSSRITYAQTQANGEDLRFFDENGTALAYDIEDWNPGGDSFVWVRVPIIDGSSNSDSIWMYYGNNTAPPGENAEAVWSGDYRGVWHLNEDPTPSGGDEMTDSTAHSNDGTTDPADGMTIANSVGGIAGNALSFDGTDDIVVIGDQSELYFDVDESFSYSLWVNVSTSSGGFDMAWSKGGSSVANAGYDFELGTSDWWAGLSDGVTNPIDQNTFGVEASFLGAWHHLTGVVDRAANTFTIYVDGGSAKGGSESTIPLTVGDLSNGFGAAIGGRTFGSAQYFQGLIDEMRVEIAARTADWVAAQYDSMTDNFITYAGEQSAPAFGGVLANDADPDDDPMFAYLLTGPSNASAFTFNEDGTFSYTPTTGFTGPDTFTYAVNDGNALQNSSSATVTINVGTVPPSDVTFSVSSTASISEDLAGTATFTVTLGGDPLTGANTASVEINATGTATSGTDYDDFVAAITAALPTGVTFDGTDTLTFDSSFNGGTGTGNFVFTVDAIDDSAVEGTETIIATLSNETVVSGTATLGTGSTTTNITEIDQDVTFALTPRRSECE